MITSLYLMPTGECNCACEYCYCPKDGRRGDPDLFRKIAASFTAYICDSDPPSRPQIRFTGGEPWIEDKLLHDIAHLFFSQIPDGWLVINTNGTLLPEDSLKDFRGDERLVHVISLDGPELLHNSRRKTICGDGTFQDVVRGIRLLMELELPIYLNTVLDFESSRYLHELLHFISSDLGLGELSISLLHRDLYRLTSEDRYGLLENAYQEASCYSIRLGGHHRLLLGSWIPELRCRAGSSTALIDPKGMVYACQRFVGRVEPDCTWMKDFDWSAFSSGQRCGPVCGGEDDQLVGEKLYELYRRDYPDYLYCHHLDKVLFGVI